MNSSHIIFYRNESSGHTEDWWFPLGDPGFVRGGMGGIVIPVVIQFEDILYSKKEVKFWVNSGYIQDSRAL